MLGPIMERDNCYHCQHLSNGLFMLEENGLLIAVEKKCWNFNNYFSFTSVLMNIVSI